MNREAFARPQPKYLTLTSYNYEDFNTVQMDCKDDLVSGRLGYRARATFRRRYLGTGSCWLSVAGWGAPFPGKISPTIIILERVIP